MSKSNKPDLVLTRAERILLGAVDPEQPTFVMRRSTEADRVGVALVKKGVLTRCFATRDGEVYALTVLGRKVARIVRAP